MRRIPFDAPEFSWEDFEQFVLRFLGSGLTLPVDIPGGVADRRILDVTPYGDKGDTQKGIDLRAHVEGGEVWCFQCKLFTGGKKRRFTKSDVQKFVTAAEDYRADRYVLVAITQDEFPPDAIDYIDSLGNWTLWTWDSLSALFRSALPESVGRQIVADFFGKETANQLYGEVIDSVLVTADAFFARTADPGQIFHHCTTLTERRSVLKALHAFVKQAEPRVLILIAGGGEGKSRVLRAFSDAYVKRHPEGLLRFVNPVAPPDESERSLNVLVKAKPLVVVQEDAHRIESIRPRLLGTLWKNEGGKLILTCRPQAIEAVRNKLLDAGFAASDVETFRLPRWKASEMRMLAENVLQGSAFDPVRLAALSGGSPLVCVVGGGLIRRGLDPESMLTEQAFRDHVFRAFEEENLNSLADRDPGRREKLSEVLRLIAVLAPYPDTPDALETLRDFLGLTRIAYLESLFHSLEAAELATRTASGWRVRPDLFADHLVYTTLLRSGKATAQGGEIIDRFGEHHGAALLRNLAEAEWRCRHLEGRRPNLVEPLWRRFRDQFVAASFLVRQEMLQSWSAFAVFLPRESLELAELALNTRDAPADERSSWSDPWKARDHHEASLGPLPSILEEVASHDGAHMDAALDLLLTSARFWSRTNAFELPVSDHPWSNLANAGKLELGKPHAVTEAYLQWLERVSKMPEHRNLFDTRCEFLAVVLEPVFARTVERSYREGARFVFQTSAVIAKSTEPLRSQVFDFLEGEIMVRSEAGCLNALEVLAVALRRVTARSGHGDLESWRPSRLRAVALARRAIEMWSGAFVRFKAFATLRSHLRYEEDEIVAKVRREAVGSIPWDLDLQVVRLASAFHTGELLDEESDEAMDQSVVRSRWERLSTAVVAEVAVAYPTLGQSLRYFERLELRAGKLDLNLNWRPVLTALLTLQRGWGDVLIDEILGQSSSPWHPCFPAIVHATHPEDAGSRDRIFARALKSDRLDLQRAIIRMLDWSPPEAGGATRAAFVEILENPTASPETFEAALNLVAQSMRWRGAWVFEILDHIPIEQLGREMLATLLVRAAERLRGTEPMLQEGFVKRLLRRMLREESLSEAPYQGFIEAAAPLFPRSVYTFFLERMERAEAGAPSTYHPLPYALKPRINLSKLRAEPGFDGMLRHLFDRMCGSDGRAGRAGREWEALFSAVALPGDPGVALLEAWLDGMERIEDLIRVVHVIRYEGSTIIFDYPGLTRALLEKAEALSRDARQRIWDTLKYSPSSRSFRNGELDSRYAYFEKEAQAAVARHARDPLLRRFYGEVIQAEAGRRERMRQDYRESMLELEGTSVKA